MQPENPLVHVAEAATLGTILMLDSTALSRVQGMLVPEDFKDARHRKVYEAMLSLAERDLPPDAVSVLGELEVRGDMNIIGSPSFVTGLEQWVINPGNLVYWAKQVRGYGQETRAKGELQRLYAEAANGMPSAELLPRIREIEANLSRMTGQMDTVNVVDAARETWEEISAETESPKNRLLTGILGFDRKTHGFSDGDLVILAARPSVGKTAWAGAIERNAAKSGKRVMLFSFEMARDQIMRRHVAAETLISLDNVLYGPLNVSQLEKVQQSLDSMSRNWRYDVYDGLSSDPEMMAETIRAFAAEGKIDLVVVDYLQLMGLDKKNVRHGDTRNQELGFITRSLKKLAREFSCPILALCQMSRAIDSRGANAMPRLSDLRESGAIEQDADTVLFLHKVRDRCRETNWMDHIDIVVAKQRNGPLGIVPVAFFGPSMKWEMRETHEKERGEGNGAGN